LKGKGTAEDPYLVGKDWELAAISQYPGACYRLVSSINLSGIHWSMAVIPDFSGTFDGNNLTIRGLTINGGDEVGLFGRLWEDAHVMDLGVEDVNVIGEKGVGGLAGANARNGVCDCSGYGGTVNHCYSTGIVIGIWGVGGLLGTNSGSVMESHSVAVIHGKDCVGGLVGDHRLGAIRHCYSMGEVMATGFRIGGLVGQNRSGITESYATSVVAGGEEVGGLLGYNSAMVIDSYARGAVNGKEGSLGGLVGDNWDGNLIDCYSTGAVMGTGKVVGGLVGYNRYGHIIACFWDRETSGQSSSAGGTSLSTTQMQNFQTYMGAWWDLIDTWMICNGTDYPRLQWEGVECSQ
jgi:trimeric autotransporter adhesin